MNNDKQRLIASLHKKLGFEDVDLNQLIEYLVCESDKADSFRESVCDTVNAYHNEKKELISIIEDLVTVITAVRDFENNKAGYSQTRQQILWDTGTEVLVKTFRVLSKNK